MKVVGHVNLECLRNELDNRMNEVQLHSHGVA